MNNAHSSRSITEQLKLHKPEYTNAVCTLAKVEIERLRRENAAMRVAIEGALPYIPDHRARPVLLAALDRFTPTDEHPTKMEIERLRSLAKALWSARRNMAYGPNATKLILKNNPWLSSTPPQGATDGE